MADLFECNPKLSGHETIEDEVYTAVDKSHHVHEVP